MSSLKEKAKTYSKLRDECETLELEQHRAFMAGEQRAKILYEKIQEFKEKEYIAIEDAQKEIDKIEEATKWLQANYEESIKNERLELKQKLQKLFKDIPFDAQLIGNKWEFYRLGTKKEWLLWIQKFEELLKEEKEAKP